MLLPNSVAAYIAPRKLYDYLLSRTHASGKSKAKFFREVGFNESNAHLLEQALLNIAHTREITSQVTTDFGTKYIVDGVMPSPKGIILHIRTVWIIETDDVQPRFVTAHPLPRIKPKR